jgi:hypothetical protein
VVAATQLDLLESGHVPLPQEEGSGELMPELPPPWQIASSGHATQLPLEPARLGGM